MIVAIAVSHNSRGYRPAGVVVVAVVVIAIVDVLLNIALKDMSRVFGVNRQNPMRTFLTAAHSRSI